MRNYITLNGKNSNEINGLLIQELPPISKPQIRTEVEEIDGRDGDIVTKLGFAAYDKEFTVGLYKDFDINAIIAYFNSEGTVVFSNEPDKYYNYQIIDQIDFERLVRYRTATVRMHCQPFKYSDTEGARTLGNKGTASGEGSFITLDNTPEAQFSKIDPKGNAEQTTYSGKNLADLVPVAGATLTGLNYATSEIVADSTLGKNVLHIVSTGAYPTVSYTLPQRLKSGKYYSLTITYRSSFAGSDWAGYKEMWFAPNWSANGWDTLGALNNGNSKNQNGVSSAKWQPSTSWTTATFRFYVDPTQYSSVAQSYTAIRLSLGYGIQSGVSSKELWIADVMLAEITQAQWNATNYTDEGYEPYVGGTSAPNPEFPQPISVVTGENTVKITGKNLFNVSKVLTNGNNTLVNNGNGTLTVRGLAVAGSTPNTLADYCPTLKAGDVATLSATTTAMANKFIYLYGANQSWAFGASKTITQAMLESRVAFYRSSGTGEDTISDIQLELGSTATTYEPYQGQSYPISLGENYLARIPNTDYEDKPVKVGDTWYIRRAVGKVVLTGNETWYMYGNGNAFWMNKSDAARVSSNTEISPIRSNYFIPSTEAATYSGDVDYGISNISSSGRLVVRNKDITTIADWRTWLSTHPTTVYYALAEPVDEEITNEALISQLEALDTQAHAYKGRTHVAAIAQGSNAPHIIEAEVQRSSDGNITNNGNIVSKPTLTIYGSGNIGVSLNGYQIFEITLGDEGYITIDTAAMEAYKDTLDNLKNRLVNGDYSKFALRPGSNMIEFSGTVSKCVISKYSRWL